MDDQAMDWQAVGAHLAQHGLVLTVVAEGIETEAQLAAVCALGCHDGQGFLLGDPCRAEAFERLLPGTRTPATADTRRETAGFGVAAPMELEQTPS